MGTDKEDSGKSANLMSTAANHNINYPNPFQKGGPRGNMVFTLRIINRGLGFIRIMKAMLRE